MSFIYAEKRIIEGQEIITIDCDTKIGLDDNARTNFSDEQINLIKKYGMVKISMLGEKICIAFAGNNIFMAAKLFNQLYNLRFFSVDDAIQRAYVIHRNADSFSDIEFIICSADDDILRIDCIKDGKILKDCPSAWLGSYNAFREFQRIRTTDLKKEPSEMTLSAFDRVVQGCGDNSVGGFHISASYRPDLKRFLFSEKSSFYSGKQYTTKMGEIVDFFLDASDGGFSIHQIPYGLFNLIIKIDQISPMILYSPVDRISEVEMNNKNLFDLMLPLLVELKENDKLIVIRERNYGKKIE